MKPLVSYIVVTHDRPPQRVMERILSSVLAQDHPRKELVLVGERCPNLGYFREVLKGRQELEQLEIIDAHDPDPNLCVWARVAAARNLGIEAARGEFLCCQDDDNMLEAHFTPRMLEALKGREALAAWCWRRVLYPDGTAYRGDFFPWLTDDDQRRDLLYRIWTKAGVIVPGQSVVRDTLWAERGAERFSTVDPNEWLVHREVYRHVRYRERYTHDEIAYHVTFDDIWDRDLVRSGLPVACAPFPGLVYFLGGASNSVPGAP